MSEFEDKLSAILGNPEAMGQIMGLAKSLGTGGGEEPHEEPHYADAEPSATGGDLFSMLGNLDPRIMQLVMNLFSEYTSNDDDRAALLAALRPFVKPKRYKKIDRAVQIAKLSRLVRVAVTSFSGGDDDV